MLAVTLESGLGLGFILREAPSSRVSLCRLAQLAPDAAIRGQGLQLGLGSEAAAPESQIVEDQARGEESHDRSSEHAGSAPQVVVPIVVSKFPVELRRQRCRFQS